MRQTVIDAAVVAGLHVYGVAVILIAVASVAFIPIAIVTKESTI